MDTLPPAPLTPELPPLGLPENQLAIRRAAAQLCLMLGWVVLHEMPLPNSRRADIMALRPDGGFVCIEVKSGPRDFLTDTKWPDYRDCSDALIFAVDDKFPLELLPEDVGVMVACVGPHCRPGGVVEAASLEREAATHRLAPATRRAMMQRFATLAAARLAMLEDPAITQSLRAALRVE